jgi:beta-glucosidase
MFYDSLPGTNLRGDRDYDPLYRFGFGLSYTDFSSNNLQISESPAPNATIHVALDVQNGGNVAGDDVVEVYIHPEQSAVLAPEKRLVGFARVHLAPSESKRIEIDVPTTRLAVTTGDVFGRGPATVEPGRYSVDVEDQSATVTLH